MKVNRIGRIRLGIDGEGVRTLIILQGCPLRCSYCINPGTLKNHEDVKEYTAEQLYEKVMFDWIYFEATGGGVTFGGGEPLLQTDELVEFAALVKGSYTIFAETSLNVPLDTVRKAAKVIDRFIVDIKTVNPEKYREYTGKDNCQVIENLKWLINNIGPERILVRVPKIPGFIDEEEQQNSKVILERIGVTDFDLFDYLVDLKSD